MKKKVLVSVLGILGIIATTIGITYAFFSYSKTGTTQSSIRSGAINFSYKEGSRKIELDEVMPMTDVQGKNQSNYFDFEISAKTSRTVDIPYDITVRKAVGENILSDSIIKVYLTRVSLDSNENEVEDEILLTNISNLNGYTNSKINIPATEKLLYTSSVKAGDTNYTQKYRLRMWIDESANYLNQTSGVDTYPLQGKTYSLTVNVYGEGLDIGESGVATRQNTNIESISLGEDTLTADGLNYTAEYSLQGNATTMTKTIVVNTENPNAQVTVERLTAASIEISKIRKISTQVELTLTKGTNSYRITVTPEDKTINPKVYNLTINVLNDAFATDSWETIIANVRAGNVERYAPVSGGPNVQSVKTIIMNIDGTEKNYKIRVANTTACTNGETSETACGFVIEFISSTGDMRVVKDPPFVNIQYVDSQIYDHINTTVYNALPSVIKDAVINTKVEYMNTSGNYVLKNDNYMYLLSKKEVGATNTNESTKILDYYNLNNNNNGRLNDAGGWWLRFSPSNYYDAINLFASGSISSYYCSNSSNVVPAFRIG